MYFYFIFIYDKLIFIGTKGKGDQRIKDQVRVTKGLIKPEIIQNHINCISPTCTLTS